MKKFASILLAMCMCLGLSATAFAANESQSGIRLASQMASQINYAHEIRDAEMGLIGEDVNKEVLDRIRISCSDDGEISYTVKNLGTVHTDGQARSVSSGTLYSVTATKKTTKGSTTEDNVDAWLNVTWIDNLGTNNELVKVSGGWDPNGRTLTNHMVYYGVEGLEGTFCATQLAPLNTFEVDDIGLVGPIVFARSAVNSNGYPHDIELTVIPTIFD